ncbi:MAG TPA: hypothetical protein VGI11_05135 [Variovorax sp.]|jgi:hypothetical protein
MLPAALILVIVLIMWVSEQRAYFRHSVRIRCESRGWLVFEVRRRVAMRSIPWHVSEYPVPREERIRLVRFAGLVIRHQEMSVALPDAACGHLEEVTAQEFDRCFPPWLRLSGTAR